MRNLTIQRTKSFVASLASMQVYIEDSAANELVINGTPCRKLGVLKSGQTQTYVIGDSAAKVFVVADKFSAKKCREYYPVPAGTEDVFLSGKNQYNPSLGNPFFFDNMTDEEVLRSRKQKNTKGIYIFTAVFMAVLVLIFALSKMSDPAAKPKTFSAEGMQITLTDDFSLLEDENFTVCYASSKYAVLVLKEEFSLMEGFKDLTAEEYAETVLYSNGMDQELQTCNGLPCFEYEAANEELGITYHYLCVFYKGPDAFWWFQFCSSDKAAEESRQTFLDWAGTVEFTD